MKNKRLIIIMFAITGLLLIPLVLNWPWTASDFTVMGVLLLTAGLGAEFVMRKVRNEKRRTALIISILVLFLLIWAELAVGLIGTPFAGS